VVVAWLAKRVRWARNRPNRAQLPFLDLARSPTHFLLNIASPIPRTFKPYDQFLTICLRLPFQIRRFISFFYILDLPLMCTLCCPLPVFGIDHILPWPRSLCSPPRPVVDLLGVVRSVSVLLATAHVFKDVECPLCRAVQHRIK